MTILLWALFGVINGLIINALEPEKKAGRLAASLLGAAGAVTGGMAAYIFFNGNLGTINSTTVVLIILEGTLLALLLSGKAFQKI
jgi:uncharacterized membrane protein YeaQ/YmgE (transglycosylase-associated protein family)